MEKFIGINEQQLKVKCCADNADEMLIAFKDELTSGKGVLASRDHFEIARSRVFPFVSEEDMVIWRIHLFVRATLVGRIARMTLMFVGEAANFVAYAYAPAVLTPLGALNIIISAVLAHFMLKKRLSKLGVLGCVSSLVGSMVIVLHAPQEESPTSAQQNWDLASQPAVSR